MYKSDNEDFPMPAPAHRTDDDWADFYEWMLTVIQDVFDGATGNGTETQTKFPFNDLTVVVYHSWKHVDEMNRNSTIKVFFPKDTPTGKVDSFVKRFSNNVEFGTSEMESGFPTLLGSFDIFKGGYIGSYDVAVSNLEELKNILDEISSNI